MRQRADNTAPLYRLASPLLVSSEQIADLNIQRAGEFHDRRQGGAAPAAQDLRQMPFREVGFEIEAVQRAVLLDHQLAQPSAE